MALQIRRGPTGDRTGVTFLSGELAFDTDQKKLYVGDGTTPDGRGETTPYHTPQGR